MGARIQLNPCYSVNEPLGTVKYTAVLYFGQFAERSKPLLKHYMLCS